MTNLILDNISLIMFLPLWIFLIIMCGRFFSVYVNKKIIYILSLTSSFLGAGICGFSLCNIKNSVGWIYPFLQINNFSISFGLEIDKLSLTLCLILFIISFAVQLFSISYMKNEKKNYRFFALLNIFNFAMSMLLFSPNLFQMYIFWELVGIISYLLIGFDYKSIKKSEASKRVFIINRIGDTALISGIVLTSYYMYSYVANKSFVTLSFEDFNAISTLLMAYASPIVFNCICGLFIMAAIVKSAQFPFYNWLQDAMEAKLPVSALLHSATMVVAGVYLIIKIMPFLTLNLNLLTVILAIGLITSIICSVLASVETNYKKILAYSTSANIGLMFIAIGIGNVRLALILLAVHAFIKSLLFISLPNENNQTSKINYIVFCITALSLAGIMFAGLSAKEILFNQVQQNQILSICLLFAVFLSAFYIIRLACLIYKKAQIIHLFNFQEFFSFVILLCTNLFLYFGLRNSYKLSESLLISLFAVFTVMFLAKYNKLEVFNKTPKIIEHLYNNVIPELYNKLTLKLNYFESNILERYEFFICLSKTFVKFSEWIEQNIMNKSVRFVTKLSKILSVLDKKLQSGNVQTYNAYAFIIVTVIIALVIAGYIIILN